MATPTLTYIVLSFLAISTQVASSNAIGKVSPLCARAQEDWWFPRVLTSCCNEQGLCSKWINPNETKYGLTNPHKENVIRECTCDKILYNCITQEMTEDELAIHRNYMFGRLMCFQKTSTINNGTHHVGKYKIYNFLSILRWIKDREHHNRVNKEERA